MAQLGDQSQISNSGFRVRCPQLRRAQPADGDSGRNLPPELGPVPDSRSDVGSDPLRSVAPVSWRHLESGRSLEIRKRPFRKNIDVRFVLQHSSRNRIFWKKWVKTFFDLYFFFLVRSRCVFIFAVHSLSGTQNRTRDGWVGSANASSVLCRPPYWSLPLWVIRWLVNISPIILLN